VHVAYKIKINKILRDSFGRELDSLYMLIKKIVINEYSLS